MHPIKQGLLIVLIFVGLGANKAKAAEALPGVHMQACQTSR